MNAPLNHQWLLTTRPSGMVKRSDFTYVETALPQPGEGQILFRTQYISLDPAMRGWMNDARSYVPPVGLGEVMRAIAVGEVVESRHPDWREGDHAVGMLGVQEYGVLDARGANRVDGRMAPLPLYLSALGMPGMTAYFGLLDVCAEGGRDGRGVGGLRGGGRARRADCAPARMPRGRDRRGPGKMPLCEGRARVRCGDRL
jgi:NADPH-dependent curcumin reductase CurA